MDVDSLGNRIKSYENVFRQYLPQRMPVIIRCDGRSFHSFTRGFNKPWDIDMREAMTEAAKALVSEISGAKLAYIQSDEISVLINSYETFETQAWFDNNLQKIVSISASVASVNFNNSIQKVKQLKKLATFDARAFVVPREDVSNVFYWRQKDATRNSVQGLGQYHFSHKKMQNKNNSQIQEMLFQEKGINWNDCETWQKRGWCVLRNKVEKNGVLRSVIEPDFEIPEFNKDREYITRHI